MRAGKDEPQGFCLDILENLMKYLPGGSYLVMKITPRVPGGISLLEIGYKYNYRKVLGFIATEGYVSPEPGNPYLSSFPVIYSNVYVCLVVRLHLIVRYFNACDAIENNNRMRQSDLELVLSSPARPY